MAVCCIGGVCIPYSALIPLLVYALKWFIEKLYAWGLVPDSVLESLNKTLHWKQSQTDENVDDDKQYSTSCCDASGTVLRIETKEQWNSLFRTVDEGDAMIVVCKFTAGWCGPCKTIQPHYEKLAKQYINVNTKFCVADVDNPSLQSLVGALGIAVLPSFCICTDNNQAVAKYSGSDPAKVTDIIVNTIQTTRKSFKKMQ